MTNEYATYENQLIAKQEAAQAMADAGDPNAPIDLPHIVSAKVIDPKTGAERNTFAPNDAVGVLVGQGLQQEAVDEAENGRVGADAERQGQNRDRGEPGGPGQRPQAVAQVCEEGRHQATSKDDRLDELQAGWLSVFADESSGRPYG